MSFDNSVKMEAICPECGTINEILFCPSANYVLRCKGTTGGSELNQLNNKR